MFCSCRISTDKRVAQSLCHSRASCYASPVCWLCCHAAAASGTEFLPPPPLAYKKWSLSEHQQVTDHTPCGEQFGCFLYVCIVSSGRDESHFSYWWLCTLLRWYLGSFWTTLFARFAALVLLSVWRTQKCSTIASTSPLPPLWVINDSQWCSQSAVSPVIYQVMIGPILWGHSGPLSCIVIVVVVVVDIDSQRGPGMWLVRTIYIACWDAVLGFPVRARC